MTATDIDLNTWPRAETFRFFRTFAQPHFSITARLDVTAMMAAKARTGLSPFRACLWALGAGLNAAPELRTRFRDERIVEHSRIDLSPTIAMEDGSFRFAYLDWNPDWPTFDAQAETTIAQVRNGRVFNPNTDVLNPVAYLSCLPWTDFTSLTNALPGPDDCVPRVAWGRIVSDGSVSELAVGIELHHALADGRHAGLFFEAAQSAFDSF